MRRENARKRAAMANRARAASLHRGYGESVSSGIEQYRTIEIPHSKSARSVDRAAKGRAEITRTPRRPASPFSLTDPQIFPIRRKIREPDCLEENATRASTVTVIAVPRHYSRLLASLSPKNTRQASEIIIIYSNTVINRLM